MAEQQKPNPIIKFTYDDSGSTPVYKTKLLDGSPGPDVSLKDIYTIKQLNTLKSRTNSILSTATANRNTINTLNRDLSEVKSDITENYPKVKKDIKSIEERLR